MDDIFENGDEDAFDDNDIEAGDDYFDILKFLSKEWIKVEVGHRVSKVASEAFWELGKEWFRRLFESKKRQNIRRKTPTFIHLRRQMYKNYVPPIYIELGYLNKDNGELTIIEDTTITPTKQFPSHRFKKLWEIAHVKVHIPFKYLLCVLTHVYKNSKRTSKVKTKNNFNLIDFQNFFNISLLCQFTIKITTTVFQ